jgi:hypothetical protein
MILALVVGFVCSAVPADAKKPKPDPTAVCLSAKAKQAAKYCAASLGAWSKFDQNGDAVKRDAALAKAGTKLAAAFSTIEQKAGRAGFDCSASYVSSSATGAFAAVASTVNAGLDLGTKDHAKCGSKILKAAALKCQSLLLAESGYRKDPAKSGAADKRSGAIAKAQQKFAAAFAKAKGSACPTTATAESAETAVDSASGSILFDLLASPAAGSGTFITIDGVQTTYDGRTYTPVCMDGSPYKFFARRGTVNKLVVYYQGGGACWEQLTCSIPTCDDTVTDGDNPNNVDSGLGDLSNPANPFRDWNIVFVSYCSCDIHFGDSAQDYGNVDAANPLHIEHRGYRNAKVVEKWAREHFLAPDEVFVTGSSAGAYGAWFNAPLLHKVWPQARFNVLADAGNGVVTQSFLDNFFPNWNFEANLPTDIPGLSTVLHDGSGIPGYTKIIAHQFPGTNWAHYSTAFDGSTGGQTGFYNLMLNDNNVLGAVSWWEGSCAFRDQMRLQAIATAATIDAADKNYRYYIGSGSRHTMYGSDKVYDDTTGGVPTIVDWIDAMRASNPGAPSPAWTNVEANPQNLLLSGDPKPNPLVAPFEQSGPDVIINCPAAP